MVDEKPDMTQQRAFTAQEVNSILGHVKRSRAREVTVPLCSGETPPVMLYPALEPPRRLWICWSRSRGCHKEAQRGWSTSSMETG